MARALVDRIYRLALVVALLAASMGVGFLLHPMFEGVSPAAEIRGPSSYYGGLPPVW